MNKLNKMYMIKQGAVDDIIKAVKDAGSDLVRVIQSGAAAISLVITAIAGLALLIVCLATGFKSWRGNSDAWGDAMQTIAVIVAVICFSTSVMAIFFPTA